MCLPCHARTQSCQVELRIRTRRESFSHRDAPARRRTPAFSRVPRGSARNVRRPTCLTNCPDAMQQLCCADAATRIPLDHPRKTAPRSTCGSLERSEQKKCSPPGCRRHADTLLCLAGADSRQRPASPATRRQRSQPCVRTVRAVRVRPSSLARSKRIHPKGKLQLLRRNVIQTTPREFALKTCHENGVVREPLVCEKRWRDPRRVNFLKEKSLRKFVLFPKLRSALPVEE